MDATQLDPAARQTLALASELRVVIGQLQRRLREQAGHDDLTHSQKQVLLHLERHGPSTVSAHPSSRPSTASSCKDRKRSRTRWSNFWSRLNQASLGVSSNQKRRTAAESLMA